MKDYAPFIVSFIAIVMSIVGTYFITSSYQRKLDLEEFTHAPRDTSIIRDTIPFPVLKFKYLKGKTVRDTVIRHDTVSIPTSFARLDTVLNNCDTVKVVYVFPPINSFDLYFHPCPAPIETKIITQNVITQEGVSLIRIGEIGLVGYGVLRLTEHLLTKQ